MGFIMESWDMQHGDLADGGGEEGEEEYAGMAL